MYERRALFELSINKWKYFWINWRGIRARRKRETGLICHSFVSFLHSFTLFTHYLPLLLSPHFPLLFSSQASPAVLSLSLASQFPNLLHPAGTASLDQAASLMTKSPFLNQPKQDKNGIR